MASLPTLEDAERAILNVFAAQSTRPGESIKALLLTKLMAGNPAPFRSSDLDTALKSMAEKGWISVRLAGWYTLTEEGFAQV